jgi:glycosyltransferase involved in cell wall biosynthesis
MDDRKNFQGLFRAWSRLPAAVREAWQLVMVCSMDDPTRNHLVHLAREAGIESRLLLTGYVPDPVLRSLYQTADLFVFPSLYEGYGLPVAEALASGARVIGSSTSSVGELLAPEARFDPGSDDDIAGAIERALTDDATRGLLDEQSRRPLPDWSTVGARVADAYRDLLDRPRPAARRRPRVAVVTPLPPAPTGIADFSYRLLAELRDHCDLHAFADGERHVDPALGPVRAPEGVAVSPARFLGEEERASGGYDCVVYCIGNSEFHGHALAQLRRRSGVVLAHEVRLTDLYALTADIPGAVPGGAPERVSAEAAERSGVLMAAEVVELSDRFVVMSQYAADRVRLDVEPALAGRVTIVPFAGRDVVEGATANDTRGPIVASFGIVNEVKQNELIVRALPIAVARVPDITVALVGPCSDAERERLTKLAADLGVADRVTITGAVPDAEYDAWLDRAAVAVQLRRAANGECSATVADCLAAGAVPIVTGIGAMRDLPADAVVAVGPSVTASELGEIVADLLGDPGRRRALVAAGRDYAAGHSYAALALRLFTDVIEPAARSGLSVPRLR